MKNRQKKSKNKHKNKKTLDHDKTFSVPEIVAEPKTEKERKRKILEVNREKNETDPISYNQQGINGLRLVCSADLDFEIRGLLMKAFDPLVAHGSDAQNPTDRSTGIRGEIDLRAGRPRGTAARQQRTNGAAEQWGNEMTKQTQFR